MALAWTAGSARGDLVWRPAPQRAATPAAPAVQRAGQRSIVVKVVRDDAVRLAAAHEPAAAEGELGHSVVVRRSGVAAAPSAEGYDPFEEDDHVRASLVDNGQPAEPDPFDPFQADSSQTPENEEADQQQTPEQPAEETPAESPGESTEEPADESADSATDTETEPAQDAEQPAESEADQTPAPEEPANEIPPAPEADQTPRGNLPGAPSVEEAFEEPQAAPQPPAVEVESPDALQNELEQGGAGEVVEPTPMTPQAEPPVVQGEMADEVPGVDATEPDIGVESAEEDAEEELQYGGPLTGELPPMTPEQQEARRQEMAKDRAESEKNCEKILADVKANGITNINLDISLKGNPGEDYPFECGLGDDRFQPRSWQEITYLWKATGLCHKPLYFEQVQLERYGHSWGPVMDPIMSGAHFFATVPLLPYKMGIESPGECVYTLGYYRPGNCAPYMIPAVPFTWRAAAYETGAAAGVILIFP